jgi:hypothetical protein
MATVIAEGAVNASDGEARRQEGLAWGSDAQFAPERPSSAPSRRQYHAKGPRLDVDRPGKHRCHEPGELPRTVPIARLGQGLTLCGSRSSGYQQPRSRRGLRTYSVPGAKFFMRLHFAITHSVERCHDRGWEGSRVQHRSCLEPNRAESTEQAFARRCLVAISSGIRLGFSFRRAELDAGETPPQRAFRDIIAAVFPDALPVCLLPPLSSGGAQVTLP